MQYRKTHWSVRPCQYGKQTLNVDKDIIKVSCKNCLLNARKMTIDYMHAKRACHKFIFNLNILNEDIKEELIDKLDALVRLSNKSDKTLNGINVSKSQYGIETLEYGYYFFPLKELLGILENIADNSISNSYDTQVLLQFTEDVDYFKKK